ncbi:MAG: hypothetical protein JW976_14560 [Syntrophaceae bacterium]|nr:hypothetical protein [Syntrophaceae bacterium]
MTGLNENHKRYLLSTFSHLDKILSEFECIIDVLIPRSTFQPYINDVTPEMRKMLEKQCDLIRQSMIRILKEQRISPAKPERSLSNSIRTSLIFADISIEELSPKYMRGYGKLSDEASDELNAIVKELRELVNRIKASLPEQSAL